MKHYRATLLVCIAVPAMAVAQQNNSMESERQRLGNERIQQDLELRAREEQRRLEEAEQSNPKSQQEAPAYQEADASDSQSSQSEALEDADLSQMLEQLRTLGELKDDGYITEAEFSRIKQRILDDRL